MSGLRFCMVTTFYPPHNFGGDGIGVQRLARALVRRGHQVTVVHDVDAFDALNPGPPRADGPNDDGVEVVRLRSGLGALSPLLTQQTGRPVVNGRRLRELLDGGGFDVINFHNVSLVGGPGVLRYGRAVKLYMAHEHWLVCPTHVLWRHGREACPERQCLRCVIHDRRPPQLWRYTGLLARELRHVDAFIAFSEFSRAKHREFGFQRDLEVVPGFLPASDGPVMATGGPDIAARPHPRPYFLFAGRLERLKGLHDVIPAFADRPAADLLVAGTGEEADALRAQAAGAPAVRFLGHVPPEQLATYYRHALALLVPSVGFETFGHVIIEAFRQGTPVIARRIGPFPEIVERCGGGELFADRAELVASLRRVATDPAHRERLARNAYAGFLEHWTEDAVLPRYLEVVRRAAERKGAARVAEALRAGAPA